MEREWSVEEVIEALQTWEEPFYSESETKWLMEKAAELLKEYEPHVLSWEEMVEAGKNHEAVWVEEYPNTGRRNRWAIAIEGVEPPEHGYNYPGGVAFNAVDADDDIFDGDLYWFDGVLSWRAWNKKPTEMQMRAVKWEQK
jgi:hypothetical protein